jgi:hypothetical protein
MVRIAVPEPSSSTVASAVLPSRKDWCGLVDGARGSRYGRGVVNRISGHEGRRERLAGASIRESARGRGVGKDAWHRGSRVELDGRRGCAVANFAWVRPVDRGRGLFDVDRRRAGRGRVIGCVGRCKADRFWPAKRTLRTAPATVVEAEICANATENR